MTIPSNLSNPEKRRKLVEGTATFGLLLICVALVVPFVNPSDIEALKPYKWVYSAGALIYLVARIVGVRDPRDTLRVRRLRRMEFWGGVAFGMGAFFWFYQEAHLGPFAGMLALMRNTIMFTLVGALIQVIASWMIASRKLAESKQQGDKNKKR
jgi:hypothetical protein